MSKVADDCIDILNDMAQIRRKLPADIKLTPKEFTDLLRVRELRRIANTLDKIRCEGLSISQAEI